MRGPVPGRLASASPEVVRPLVAFGVEEAVRLVVLLIALGGSGVAALAPVALWAVSAVVPTLYVSVLSAGAGGRRARVLHWLAPIVNAAATAYVAVSSGEQGVLAPLIFVVVAVGLLTTLAVVVAVRRSTPGTRHETGAG